MTTFSKNPHAEARKKINFQLFKIGLDYTIKKKFKHKKFSERFAMANAAFIGMGAIAQFASLTTAFTMLSYLFVNINIIARVVCAAALVLFIEAIKRESTNDVMKGVFQYKEVERFPAILALITIGASIYISVEGAKILPTLFIDDAIKVMPVETSSKSIEEDFAARIADKEKERNEYRKKRTWKGRLASKDAAIIKEYNEDIKLLQEQKDKALTDLKTENTQAITTATNNYQKQVAQVKQDRAKLGKQLVYAAIGFEVLFLFSMCFSWCYYTECAKEKNTLEVTAKTPINTGIETLEVQQDTPKVQADTLEVEGSPRAKRKVSFKDYQEPNKDTLEVKQDTSKVQSDTLEVKSIEKEFTRICPQCNTPFIHRTHNHKFCKRSCMLKARKSKKNT